MIYRWKRWGPWRLNNRFKVTVSKCNNLDPRNPPDSSDSTAWAWQPFQWAPGDSQHDGEGHGGPDTRHGSSHGTVHQLKPGWCPELLTPGPELLALFYTSPTQQAAPDMCLRPNSRLTFSGSVKPSDIPFPWLPLIFQMKNGDPEMYSDLSGHSVHYLRAGSRIWSSALWWVLSHAEPTLPGFCMVYQNQSCTLSLRCADTRKERLNSTFSHFKEIWKYYLFISMGEKDEKEYWAERNE